MSKKQEHKPVAPAKLGSPGRPNSKKARREALGAAQPKKASAKTEAKKPPAESGSSKSGG